MKSMLLINDDCLDAFRSIESSSIDMVYLDPPFFTQKRQSLRDSDGNEYGFSDLWQSRSEYLSFIEMRLREIRRVLKESGTVFFHCDSTASHYIKILLDNVFGENNFQSEIVWCYKRWSNSRNGLLAGQVDSGSMAYVLSTPTKRRTVSTTQMLYLLVSLLAMFLLVTAVSVVSIWIVGGNTFAINFGEILFFNLGAFLTMFAFAGFCFMCSAIFNRTKYSMSIGGGISMFMLVCTILGLFGSQVVPAAMRIDQMNFFNYLSIITLFDTSVILAGGFNFLIGFGVLALIGIVTFIVGTFVFDKKDLPL